MNTAMRPAEFASAHTRFMQNTVGPLAEKNGCKSYNSKLQYAVMEEGMYIGEETQSKQDVRILKDDLSLAQGDKRSLPLKDLYSRNSALVQADVEQATKSTGGVLNADSARFLPMHLQNDYERLTGDKASPAAGSNVEGVTVETKDGVTTFNVQFEKALAGVTTDDVVLAVSENAALIASQLPGGVEHPELPHYNIFVSARHGSPALGADLQSGHGTSGFSTDSGHIIGAGHTELKLVDRDKSLGTLAFDLDVTNDYGSRGVEPSQGTAKVRTAWETFCENGQFSFDEGLKAGKLQSIELAEVRQIQGIKPLLSALRDSGGAGIREQVKAGLLEFAIHPESNSLAALRRIDGALEHNVSIVDLDTHHWVGTFAASDDGTYEWRERELG